MDDVINVTYEIEAFLATETHGPSAQLDRVLRAQKLAPFVAVSEEAAVEWLTDKFKLLIHKMHIFSNEIYATLTNADKDIHEAIAQAKALGPDHKIAVPVTKTGMFVSVAVLSASAAAIVAATAMLKTGKPNAVTEKPEEAVSTKDVTVGEYLEAVGKASDKVQTAAKDFESAITALPEGSQTTIGTAAKATAKVHKNLRRAKTETVKVATQAKKKKWKTVKPEDLAKALAEKTK